MHLLTYIAKWLPFACYSELNTDLVAYEVELALQEPLLPDLTAVLENFEVPDGWPGLPVASPSKARPNYYYHWTRDGALAAAYLLNQYIEGGRVENALRKRLFEYLASTRRLQKVHNKSGGVGEPKFNVDGTPFEHKWGRPQHDSPAIRALVLSKLAHTEGMAKSIWPALQLDLQWTANNIGSADGFDLWEERRGKHFFTAMMQYGALRVGLAIAKEAGKLEDAKYMEEPLHQAFKELKKHGHASPGTICEHIDGECLDCATVLASLELHDLASWTEKSDSPLPYHPSSPLIQNAAFELALHGTQEFNVNSGKPGGVGRYPGDIYDGYGSSQGNPWFICTAAVAEALAASNNKQALMHLSWINEHRGLTLSEQANRDTGFMQGAANLTWSYTSTSRARQVARRIFIASEASKLSYA